ncbi:MAG: aminoglycoside phosphotransferase family protein [Oscillospiraceae bacterium]|nr:aminoglycoside phosphotransferase family protein [Oscillospiraceae bacterium]
MSRPNEKVLTKVLRKMFNADITRTVCQTVPLHGGTLGDVRLVTGTAEAAGGGSFPYKVVWKTQKKWERYGDPGSWRREYDLYTSGLDSAFTESFRWPDCYHAEISKEENEIQLWMEYIDGVSGLDLTGGMYERAAGELGRFQGRLYAGRPSFLLNLTNMSKADYAKSFYLHYRSWEKVYDYIRSDDCGIPGHICKMLISIDENSDEVFTRIEKLPLVLCHRDFWVANIFCSDGKIVLIDWDTTGWGYLGEDIASLIADEADAGHMAEHFQRCVPAYYKGFSEYADSSHITDHCVHELILVLFGYRLVEWYLNAESDDGKMLQINTLQKIYEMKGL